MFFSVTVPAFKKKYLKECIDSILGQSYSDFELIIVNDDSPEDLDSIINTYSDPRIRYYKNDKNCGAINVVDNWNKCLEYAKGDYIICMGDDDRLLPCCLDEYVKLMKQYPGLGVYHAWTEIIDENGDFYKLQHPRPLYEGALSLIWNRWNGRSLQFIGDFCFDRHILTEIGGFYYLPMAWASDEITAVLAADKKGIANTQRICFQYRENRNSITKSGDWKIKIKATLKEEKWIEDYLGKQNIEDLSSEESKYLIMLVQQKDSYFSNKFKYNLKEGFATKSISIFNSLVLRKSLHLNMSDIIISWIKSRRNQ